MPGTVDPKAPGEPHKAGLLERLGLIAPANPDGEAETTVAPTAGQKPAAATTPISSAFVAGVQIDQAKFDSAVATLTANYPGLVILDQVWQESDGMGFTEQQRIGLALKRLATNKVTVPALLEQFSHAVTDVEKQEQLVLGESAKLLDSKVGSLRRQADSVNQATEQARAQIAQIQASIAAQEQQRTDLLAQADAAERLHNEGEATKLATVAATKQHFIAQQELIRRNTEGK